MKNFYVENLQDGARIEDVFLVSEKAVGETQQGSQFVRLKLCDRTGAIDAIKWDANDCLCSSFCIDDYVYVKGAVQKYRDKLQVRVDGLHKHADKVDPADFLPKSSRDIPEMMADLRGIIASVRHPQLSALMDHFFQDEEFVTRFSSAPAATRIHHAYIGGLLQHSLSVARLCDTMSGHFPTINRDLLLTAAVLHDAGKTEEFCWSKSIKYSDCGHMIGHIVRGATMVESAASAIPDFHPLLAMTLAHIILSHHGEKEWGSPKRPKCLEAILLHYADNIDAKVEMFTQACAAGAAGADGNLWTERHWLLDRPLMRGLPKSVLGEPEIPADVSPDADQDDFDPFSG